MNARKVTSLILALLLLVPAWPAGSAPADQVSLLAEAVAVLRSFQIVQGDPSGDIRPYDPITRAEMIKVLVVAAGKSGQADLLKEAVPFPDVAGHWGAGYIAVARNLEMTSGYEDGTFRPQRQVTVAEVIKFVSALVGVKPDGSDWPGAWVRAARSTYLQEGLALSDADAAAPARRGDAFVLAHLGFARVQDIAGRNLYQRQFDAQPPQLALNPATASGGNARITGRVSDNTGVAGLSIDGTRVNVAVDGSFSHEVAISSTGGTVAVVAVDLVGNRAEETVTVAAATPGAMSAPARIEVAAGQAVDVAVVVRDGVGEPIPDAVVTGESALGSFDGASRQFTAGEKAGEGVLTLRSGGRTALVAVTVRPDVLAKLTVTPGEANLAPGEAGQFKVTGEDRFGNPIKNLTPTWSAGPAGSAAVSKDGLFIGSAAGTFAVTATVGDVTGSAAAHVFGAAARLVVSGPAEMVGNGGTAAVKVTAVDANGRQVRTYTQTISLASASPGVTVTPDGITVAGEAMFKISAGPAAVGQIVSLNATAPNPPGPSLAGTASVNVAAQVPTGVKLTLPEYLATNMGTETALASATVVDQEGRPMLSGAYAVRFTVSGGAWAGSAGQTSVDGSYIGTVTPSLAQATLLAKKGETGVITVTASLAGVGSDEQTMGAVVAGLPAEIRVKALAAQGRATGLDEVEVTVAVTDNKGVPVEGPSSLTAAINFAGALSELSAAVNIGGIYGAYGPVGATITVPLTAGAGRLKFKAGAAVGQVTVQVTGSGLAAASDQFTFVAGPVAQVGFLVPTLATLGPTGGSANFRARLFDAGGNPVSLAGVAVTFTPSGNELQLNGAAHGAGVTANTDANGVAEVEVNARPYTGTFTIGVTAAGLGVLTGKGTASVTVAGVVPTQVAVEVRGPGDIPVSSVPAGTPLTVRVTARDQFGNGAPGYAANLSLSVTSGALTTAAGTFFDATGGVYNASVTPARGPMTVKVTLDLGSAVMDGTANVAITPGPPSRVFLVRASESTAVKVTRGVASGPFTLQVTDAYLNVVPPTLGVSVTFGTTGLDPGSTLAIRTESSGTDVSSLTISTAVSAVTFYVVTDDPNTVTLHLYASGGATAGDTITIETE